MKKLVLTAISAVALLTFGGVAAGAATVTPTEKAAPTEKAMPAETATTTEKAAPAESMPTQKYCVVSDIKFELPCKDGDVLVYDSHFASFLRTTSEEIAMVCDLNKPVVITGPDFICTYQQKQQEQFKDSRTEEAKKPKSIFR